MKKKLVAVIVAGLLAGPALALASTDAGPNTTGNLLALKSNQDATVGAVRTLEPMLLPPNDRAQRDSYFGKVYTMGMIGDGTQNTAATRIPTQGVISIGDGISTGNAALIKLKVEGSHNVNVGALGDLDAKLGGMKAKARASRDRQAGTDRNFYGRLETGTS